MTDRLTADTINSDALDALYDEIDRLRAGEEDGYDPLAVPTPGQWIHQFNQATAEKRLEVVGRLIDAAERVWACTMNGHEERIHDGRHAEMVLNEVRQVVADMENTTGARTWAGWLREAMKRGPEHCLMCAVETKAETAPAATEATEEHDLVHALGGDRTAKTIAHTLTVHGHTLDAVRTMTYAELLAIPGIGGPSLARIRESLDGWPDPEGTDQVEIGDIQITRKLGHGLIVDHAPPRARLALAVLTHASWGAALQGGDRINIGDQVLYRVTGYDPEHAALLLELVEDWRPVPTAKLTEADVEELKARWLAAYGNNQGAHHVTELRPTDEEQH